MINRIVGLFFLGFFLVFGSLIPIQISSKAVPPGSPLPIYPEFFPVILAILGGSTSLLLFFVSFSRFKSSDEKLQLPTKRNLLRLAGVALIICFHVLTFNFLGYLISTSITLIVLMAYLGLKDIKSYVFMTAVFPLALFFLFKKLLYVAFPVGVLGF